MLSQITVDQRQLYDALPEASPSAADDPAGALALFNLLQALDPAVAARWHWRDTRKVLRNLNIMKDSGRKVSEVLQEQSAVALSPRWVPVGASLFCALSYEFESLGMTLCACGCTPTRQSSRVA